MEILNKDKINYKIEDTSIISKEVLTPLSYQYKSKRNIDIIIDQPEFTSVCPMTGLPDIGCITIQYTPDQKIVELKSLKFYLLQYRNVGIFYEHLVNKILEDLVAVIEPLTMKITGNFTARGGIVSKVSVSYKK